MIARLFKIALFTGAAHLFTLITLKILSERTDSSQISLIGELDSLTQFIISIIAFGLQLSAVRDIAITDDWKTVYQRTQRSRSALGILMILLALLYFIKPVYGYFIFAPVFALSGDYALYGRGQPISASSMAFLRVFFPSFILIICSLFFPDDLIPAYIGSTVLVYWATNIIISRWLGTDLWHPPSFRSLIYYIKSLNLGIVTLSYYFLGLGLLVIAALLYSEKVIAVAYLGLKLYVIYKGVLRIINQAFIKEMVHDMVGMKVDQMAMLAGILFAASLIIFPESMILLFFNEQYVEYKNFLLFIGLSGLIFSLSSSLTTRSMLRHKDRAYAMLCVVSMLVSSILVIMLSFYQSPTSLGISLLCGELIASAGLFIINRDVNIKGRGIYLLRLVAILAVPVALRVIGGDDPVTLTAGMLLFGLVAILLVYKQFLKPAILNDNTIGQS